MSESSVVLHIGLHKTATRFLQRAVFSSLDSEQFLVNPSGLMRPLRRALRHRDRDAIERAAEAVEHAKLRAGGRTLVVSEPQIAGDMYSAYKDWAENLGLIEELFPQASIVYFVRGHADWLHSAYRQVLAKGPGVPIEFFLNFRDGEFQRRPARFVGGARNLDALELDFLGMYLGYAQRYGPESVYLFRQEDLRRRPEDVYRRLAEALGLAQLPALPERVSGNRGMSALAIHLLFPGVHIWPRGRAHNEARQFVLLKLRRRLRRLRRVFVQHIFDRLIYRDWDLLARHGMRERLDRYYRGDAQVLAGVADTILEHGPGGQAYRLAEQGRDKVVVR